MFPDLMNLLPSLEWMPTTQWLSMPAWYPIGFFSSFGYTEMLVIGVLALLLFGSRLPEVARNFGQTYRQLRGKVDEFQREFRNWDQEVQSAKPAFTPEDDDDTEQKYIPQSPKFVPPTDDDDD